MSIIINMKTDKAQKQRQSQIVELVSQAGKMEVRELAEHFGVSQVTIRKDLDELERRGTLRREHGYACLMQDDDIHSRMAFNYENKLAIARRAARDIHPGETLMVESGSCCALLARELAETIQDVTLITNSGYIADFVRKAGNIRVILLGGEYQQESQVNVGPMIRECAKAFHVNKMFVGTDGFSEDQGFTGNDYMRAEAVRSMADHAEEIIVVTESGKFFRKGVVTLFSPDRITAVYTDSKIPEEKEQILQKLQIDVIKAETA